MRLDYLKIHDFKNLIGFSVDFDETSKEPVTVVLGRNGSGKSNLNEALVIIFRDLLKGKPTKEFGYDLRYTLRNGEISVRVWNPTAAYDESGDSATLPFTSKEGDAITSFAFTIRDAEGKDRRLPAKLRCHLLLWDKHTTRAPFLQAAIGVSQRAFRWKQDSVAAIVLCKTDPFPICLACFLHD
jgi:predicted ATP-dependent endonuclease of OLD family